jgi:lysophospholipase L1-like esterase
MPIFNISRYKLFISFLVIASCYLVFSVDILQPIINVLINKKAFFWNEFLEEDSEFGWRNKPGAKWVFPEEGYFREELFDKDGQIRESIRSHGLPLIKVYFNPERYRVSYQIDKSGQRRGFKYTPSQLKNAKKIIWIVGDSTPFGYGVSEEFIFPYLLQKKLANKGIVIKNFSVVGYDLRQLRKVIQFQLKRNKRKPNLIIFWGGFNNTPLSRKGLWKWAPVKEITYLSYRYQLWRIRKLCQEKQIKLLISTLPSLRNLSSLERINAVVRSLKKNDYLDIADIEPIFRVQNHPDLYAPIDDMLNLKIHPSAIGHRIIYEELLRKLDPQI